MGSVAEPSLHLRKRINEELKWYLKCQGKGDGNGDGDRMTFGPYCCCLAAKGQKTSWVKCMVTAGVGGSAGWDRNPSRTNSSQRGVENAAAKEVAMQPKAMPKP